MRTVFFAFALIVVWTLSAGAAAAAAEPPMKESHIPPDRYASDPTDRIVHKEVTVTAPREEVWRAWTTTEGVNTFFSPDAHVELRAGGPYEIYFIPSAPYGERGSEGCRVLSYLPMEMFSFEWNAPPSFGDLRGIHTWVVLRLDELGDGRVRVRLDHLGWGEGEDWAALSDYFDKAWSYVLGNLEKRFREGPISWGEE